MPRTVLSASTRTMGSEAIAVARTAVDRFTDPLYTRAEAARFLGITATTLVRWIKDTPFVTVPQAQRSAAHLDDL